MKKSILFPGQGSQYVGMGLDLYNSYQEAKDTYHEVDEALKLKLSDIIFNEGAGDINLTAKHSTSDNDNRCCNF